MPNASLHITLGIWPSRIGRSCTKWYWCSWQNKLQWLLNHMNYLSLWLVSHGLQTNVLLWLPLHGSDKNHLGWLTGQWQWQWQSSWCQHDLPRSLRVLCPWVSWLCPLHSSGWAVTVAWGRWGAGLLWAVTTGVQRLHLHTAPGRSNREKCLGLRRNWTYPESYVLEALLNCSASNINRASWLLPAVH